MSRIVVALLDSEAVRSQPSGELRDRVLGLTAQWKHQPPASWMEAVRALAQVAGARQLLGIMSDFGRAA